MNLLTVNLPKEQLQKVILVALGALVGVALSYQFLWSRGWTRYTKAGSEIDRLTAAISETEHRQQTLTSTAGANQQMRSFVETQQAAMVSGDAFAWVVREISLLADEQPIRVVSLRPGLEAGPAGADKSLAVYAVRLEITGEYDAVGRFIRDLENRFPTAEIRSLELVANSTDDGHQANLDFTIMVRPKPAKPEETTS